MRKLKLESLQVESFETVAPHPVARGTVHGHRPNTDGCPFQPGTGVSDCMICQPMSQSGTGVSDCMICQPMSQWGCEASINICRDTEYMDCTYGCTRNTCDARINSCGDVCWIENTAGGCTIVG